MFKNSNKGFTLIELLVVIAIIGILASIVLASLNSARAKGADAAVKGAMANMAAQMELFYDSNGNDYGVFTLANCPITTPSDTDIAFTEDPVIQAAIEQIKNNSEIPDCVSTSQNWAMRVDDLRGAGTSWCVDNTGWRKPAVSIDATNARCQ